VAKILSNLVVVVPLRMLLGILKRKRVDGVDRLDFEVGYCLVQQPHDGPRLRRRNVSRACHHDVRSDRIVPATQYLSPHPSSDTGTTAVAIHDYVAAVLGPHAMVAETNLPFAS
jgi:hypothetical protein